MTAHFNKKPRAYGFTLVEILVVIGLLGVLTTAGLTSYSRTQKNSRDAKRKADLEQLRVGLEQYRADNSAYPNVTAGSTETNLKPSMTAPVPYFSATSFPKDPQNRQNFFYYYQRNPGGGGVNTYRLCTYVENIVAGDPACPNAAANCKTVGGNVACNYGLTQP